MTLMGFEAAKPKKKREEQPSTQPMRASSVSPAQRRNLTPDEKRYKREQRVRRSAAFGGPGYYLVDKDGTPQSQPFSSMSEAEAQLQPESGHLIQYLTQAPNAAHIAEPFPPNLQQVNGSLMTLASHSYDDEMFLFEASSDEEGGEEEVDTSRGETDNEEHPDCGHCHHSFSSHGSTNGGPCEVCSCEHYDAGGEGGEEKEAAKTASLLPPGMSFTQREAQILGAMAVGSLDDQQALMGELEQLRTEARLAFDAEREIDLSSAIVRDHLTPVPVHEHHTAATDWIEDVAEPSYTPQQVFASMVSEAKLWSDNISPAVKADREEYVEQAHGIARRVASTMGQHAESAYEFFMKAAGAWGDDGAPAGMVAPWSTPPQQLPPVGGGDAPFGVPSGGGPLNGQNFNPMAEEVYPGSAVPPLDNGASAWPPADNLEGEGPLPPVAPDNYNSVGAETHMSSLRYDIEGSIPHVADVRDPEMGQLFNVMHNQVQDLHDKGISGKTAEPQLPCTSCGEMANFDKHYASWPSSYANYVCPSCGKETHYKPGTTLAQVQGHEARRQAHIAARSIAGPSVDESHLKKITELGRQQHGDKFDESELRAAKHFAPYLHNGTRLKVRRDYGDGEYHERTGTVGKTTGWRPAFLLMHRSSDRGSSDVLGPEDEITHVHDGRGYRPVKPASDYGVTSSLHTADDDGSIYCGKCKGQGMVRAGGAVRNCGSCGGSGLKRRTRKDLKGEGVLPDSNNVGSRGASQAFNGPKQTYEEYLARLSDGAAPMDREHFAGSMASVSPSESNVTIPVTGAMVRWAERGIDPDPTGADLAGNPMAGYPEGGSYDKEQAHLQSGEAQTNLPLAPEGPKVTDHLDFITDFPDTGPAEVPSDRAPNIDVNAGPDQDKDAENDAFKRSLSALGIADDGRPLDEIPHPFQRYASTRYCKHCGEDPAHPMHVEAARILADKVPGRGKDQEGPDFEPNRGGYVRSPQGDATATQDYEDAYSSDRHIDYSETGIGQLGTVPVQGYGANPQGEMFAWQIPPGPGPVGAADVGGVPTPGAASGGYPQPQGAPEAPEGKEARLQAARARVAATLGGGR